MDKDIPKPSLTQRRKITGSRSMKDDSGPIIKPLSEIGKKHLEEFDESGGDISVGKVVLVFVAIIILAVVAAVVFLNFQNKSTGDVNTTTTPTESVEATPTVEDTPTESPTVSPTITETPTDTTTPTPTTTQPAGANDFSQNAQSITSTATGNTVKIRTYQYKKEKGTSFFEFALPVVPLSGTEAIPNAEASYNDAGDIVLKVKNIGSFTSCNHLNENNSGMAFGNVIKVTCERVTTGEFNFTIDIKASKTDFKLFTDKRPVTADEEVDAVIIQVKNN